MFVELIFHHGVDVGALLFIPQSAGVCGFSTLNVMGLILFKLNPLSFSSKDLQHVKMSQNLCVGACCHPA